MSESVIITARTMDEATASERPAPVSHQLTGEPAEVFLQWKGTDACFDFHCPCGESQHIDAEFAYYVRCPSCGVIYRMPSALEATAIDPATDPEYAGHYVQGEVNG